MSEIFVEEENTVYEIDEECLKRKSQREQMAARSRRGYHAQEVGRSCLGIVLNLLCICIK